MDCAINECLSEHVLDFSIHGNVKGIVNTKTQFLSLFKREQQYTRVYAFIIIIKKHLKNNQLIPGNNYYLL